MPIAIKTWLSSIEPQAVIEIYKELNEQLPAKNGYVTETNDTIANVTGSSSNAILLGNTQQSKAALFYVAPYICKNKMALEHCLTALSRAQAHVDKHKSTASDAGTSKRTVQYMLTRVLNSMYCHRELSDTQVALALLNRLGSEACSDTFRYYGAGYFTNFVNRELQLPKAAQTHGTNERGNDDSNGNHLHMPVDDPDAIPIPRTAELGPAPFYKKPIYQSKTGDIEVNNDDVESDSESNNGDLSDQDYDSDSSEESNDATIEKTKYEYVPVHYQTHYRHCGPELSIMTPNEYFSLVDIRPLPKSYKGENELPVCEYQSTGGNGKPKLKAGRKLSRVFRFAPEHPLYTSHYQYLRSKQPTLIYNGYAPPFPGSPPQKPENNVTEWEKHYKVWKKKADVFAKYYLCSFRPLKNAMRDGFVSDPTDFNWEALVKFVQDYENSPYLVHKLRLDAMFNHMYGFRSKYKHQKTVNAFRMRNRIVWTDAQLAENKELFAGFKSSRRLAMDEDGFDCSEYDGVNFHIFQPHEVRKLKNELRYCIYQDQALQTAFGTFQPEIPTEGNSETSEFSNQEILQQQYKKVLRAQTEGIRNGRTDKTNNKHGNSSTKTKSKQKRSSRKPKDTETLDDYLKKQKLSDDQRYVIDKLRTLLRTAWSCNWKGKNNPQCSKASSYG